MKINSLINITSSLCQITTNLAQNVGQKLSLLLEENLIKGKYVSREEHEVLQEQVKRLKSDTHTSKTNQEILKNSKN